MPEAAPREPRSFVCVQDPGLWPVTGLRPVCIDILRSITVLSEILRSILRGGCERERKKIDFLGMESVWWYRNSRRAINLLCFDFE